MTGPFGRRARRAKLAYSVALGLMLSALGCSTTYQPKSTGRVGLGIKHASLVYTKDGKIVGIGPFSGELVPLVNDVPAATKYAERAHTQFMVGVPAYLAGGLGIILGLVVLSGPVGWTVFGVGAASAGTGLGFLGAGVTNAFDAVNIHNDAVSGDVSGTQTHRADGNREHP